MKKLSKHFDRVTEVYYSPASLPAAEQVFVFRMMTLLKAPLRR